MLVIYYCLSLIHFTSHSMLRPLTILPPRLPFFSERVGAHLVKLIFFKKSILSDRRLHDINPCFYETCLRVRRKMDRKAEVAGNGHQGGVQGVDHALVVAALVVTQP